MPRGLSRDRATPSRASRSRRVDRGLPSSNSTKSRDRRKGAKRSNRVGLVFNFDNRSWSSCGAERSQPTEAQRRTLIASDRVTKPKPLLSSAARPVEHLDGKGGRRFESVRGLLL